LCLKLFDGTQRKFFRRRIIPFLSTVARWPGRMHVSVNIREDSALLEAPLHACDGNFAPPSTSSTFPPEKSYRHGQKAAFRASLHL